MAKFKARARALDLLGRQQIAGIPTAINELFKNAHDAYADNVEVDYFRKEKLFVLRDDGLGMTRKEFESRWLTLGTESKLKNSKTSLPPIHPDKSIRPTMGEKGIGRLAIASIGSQILILTKAIRENEEHKIVSALINWRIFELPGLDLDDVLIPIEEFDSMPGVAEIDILKSALGKSVEKLKRTGDIASKPADVILNEIQSFTFSPSELDGKLLGEFSLDGGLGGTHFYIAPVDESLNSDIDGEKNKKVSTKIEKMLSGFTNTITPDHPKPRINTDFRDYAGIGSAYKHIISKDTFFTPDDFEISDHHFSGTFDEFGQFSGKVNVYRQEEFEHKILWSGNNYKVTECGPFSINVAYIQGRLNHSILGKEDWMRLEAKTFVHGGLYLYKDDIRVLPYGNSDFDWLDIERNRSFSASHYFFSFRRMFGVVNITHGSNNFLREKAGREGFLENKAYRQFRDILKNFFVQLAADFFREGTSAGPKAETWLKIREGRKVHYAALERRDKQAKVRKEKFVESLNGFFEDLQSDKFTKDVNILSEQIEKRFEDVAYLEEPEEASQALLDAEIRSREEIEKYLSNLKINQPKGFTVGKAVREDYDAYATEYEKLRASVASGVILKIDDHVEDYSNRLEIEISKRKRLEQAVESISKQAERAARQKSKETKEALSAVTKGVMELARELMIDLEDKIKEIKEGFTKYEINTADDFDLVQERKRVEDEIGKERDRASFALESIIKQLQSIYWSRGEDNELITSDMVSDAMSEELEELRERVQTDIELSQLGLAVGVIHHEFNSTVTSIRNSLRDLKAWADVNEKLDGVYNNIRTNFEHLDGYLTLFTPLNRRLYRTKEDISSSEVKSFLLDLFKARLARHNIQLIHSSGFKARKLHGFRSTFYPVFVNIIDNAIHWLNESPDLERIIRLHADDHGFYISNNGPEISVRDAERIFDLGFTRKLNGRGMGLHISKEVLQSEDYELLLDTPRKKSNVTFKISKTKGDS